MSSERLLLAADLQSRVELPDRPWLAEDNPPPGRSLEAWIDHLIRTWGEFSAAGDTLEGLFLARPYSEDWLWEEAVVRPTREIECLLEDAREDYLQNHDPTDADYEEDIVISGTLEEYLARREREIMTVWKVARDSWRPGWSLQDPILLPACPDLLED